MTSKAGYYGAVPEPQSISYDLETQKDINGAENGNGDEEQDGDKKNEKETCCQKMLWRFVYGPLIMIAVRLYIY